MSFVPYHSPKGTADLAVADAEFRQAIEAKLDHMRRITTRWVPSLQRIAADRPEMHWCTYDDGRVVAFIDLERDEAFADLQDLYDFVAAQVRHLKSLGNYKGTFVDEPDPEDDQDISWRKWHFRAGDSQFVLNCSFSMSQHCKLVDDGEETVVVKKRRVICDGGTVLAA